MKKNIIHLAILLTIFLVSYWISSHIHVKYAIVPHDSMFQTYERVYETKDAAQSYIRDYEEFHHYKLVRFFVIESEK